MLKKANYLVVQSRCPLLQTEFLQHYRILRNILLLFTFIFIICLCISFFQFCLTNILIIRKEKISYSIAAKRSDFYSIITIIRTLNLQTITDLTDLTIYPSSINCSGVKSIPLLFCKISISEFSHVILEIWLLF